VQEHLLLPCTLVSGCTCKSSWHIRDYHSGFKHTGEGAGECVGLYAVLMFSSSSLLTEMS
jgi:hypothetical protein